MTLLTLLHKDLVKKYYLRPGVTMGPTSHHRTSSE